MRAFSILTCNLLIFAPLAFGNQLLSVQDKKPPQVILQAEQGGIYTNSQPWNSDTLKSQLHLLFYIDPDSHDINDHFTERLKKEAFGSDVLGSVAIVNMKASWKPNVLIRKVLGSKQREFPDTTYVLDMDKVLVKKWQLKDDNFNTLLFDEQGQVIFSRHGKLSEEDVEEFVNLVRSKSKQPQEQM